MIVDVRMGTENDSVLLGFLEVLDYKTSIVFLKRPKRQFLISPLQQNIIRGRTEVVEFGICKWKTGRHLQVFSCILKEFVIIYEEEHKMRQVILVDVENAIHVSPHVRCRLVRRISKQNGFSE